MNLAWISRPVPSVPSWGPVVLQAIIAHGVALEVYEGHWLNAAAGTGILLPIFLDGGRIVLDGGRIAVVAAQSACTA